MAYTAQFDLLSPCYKKGEQPAGFHMGGVKAKPAKKGKKATKAKKPSTTKKVKKGKSSKQRGGSSCGASLSVAEMGVVDKPPASLPKSHSQDAFLERYSNNIMKGGATEIDIVNNTVLNPKPNNNKTKALNEIKNKLIPSETISGFALIVKKISKNNKNSRNDKYSIEIVSKEENGTTQIEKLDKTEFDFRGISDNVYKISKKVFPPPEKTQNGTTQANANTKANAQTQPNAQTQTQANANAKAKAKAKANANANAQINSLF
jgi:hypothetical protein